MNYRQNNKARMYISINNCCARPENQAAVTRIPAFAREYQLFQSISGKILEETRRQQGSISVGITEDKGVVRATMADQASRIAAAVQTFADVAGDRTLFASVNYTRSDFINGREIDAANLAENVLAIATEKLGILGDYGVDQILRDELDAIIDRFSAAIGKPRAKITDRKTVTDTLPILFAQADQHLQRLDRLTKVLENTHPDFVLGYRNARPIVSLRGSQSSVAAAAAITTTTAVVIEPMPPVLLPASVTTNFIIGEEDTAAA